MTEIEMEHDGLKGPTFATTHLDDDLINYDSDTEAQVKGADDLAPPLAPELSSDMHHDGDHVEFGNTEEHNKAAVNQNGNPQLTAGDDAINPNTHEPDQQTLSSKDADHDFVDFDVEEQYHDEHTGNAAEAPYDDNSAEAQEIDYEHDDISGIHDTEQNSEDTVGQGLVPSEYDARPASGDAGPSQQPGPDTVSATGQPEEESNETAQNEEDEITWDEAETHDHPETTSVHGVDVADSNIETSHEQGVEGGYEAADEVEHADGTAAEEYSHEMHHEQDPSAEDTNDGDNVVEDAPEIVDSRDLPAKDKESFYPAITVQYRGDEFPFFAEGTEGFFSEVSVLDDNMESVLAGFRAELINEIPHEEELVFQVDELGLEFAESQLRDNVSGITLRQILEVFDLLVKNQDPDSSRVLYTYLFTKPTTSKRFESLIESATAGKGLDEVIHLFGSPMPQGTAGLVADANASNSHDDHSYDSGVDEMREGEYEAAGIDTEDITHEDNTTHAQDMPQIGQEFGEPLGTGVGDEKTRAVEESILDNMAEADNLANVDSPNALMDQYQLNGDLDKTLLPDDEEYNAISGLEAHEPAEVEVEAFAEEQGDDLSAALDATEDNINNTTTRDNTSTTATLDDDGDAATAMADIDMTLIADAEIPEEVSADPDALDEIDWREEPEAEAEAEAGVTIEAEDTLHESTGAKRSRAEDELDMEDDKDVKRHRS